MTKGNKMKDEIIYILDRSGSMMTIIDDAIGGFNANLKEQKDVGDANVTVVLFDNEYETLYDRVPINEVPEMTRKTYVPRGSTALLDAVGRTVSNIKSSLSSCCKECGPRKVSVVIVTDGKENASREFNRDTIKEMLKHQQEEHDWQVLFLAANQDAISEGGSMGVYAPCSLDFASTPEGVRNVYKQSSARLRSYRTSK
jgi:uncharacterized protein YegL